MIAVDRSRVPPPACLAPTADLRLNEEKAHAEYHASKKRPKDKPKFKVYGRPEVKKAVRELFCFKCGFCETRHSPGQVEHFRPKSKVGDKEPGYWFLACEWDNLLLACADCNRSKSTQFPLSNGPNRVTRADYRRERPLLLDPTHSEDGRNLEQHLEFCAGGVIRPKKNGCGESKRGKATIDVANLARTDLNERREDRLDILHFIWNTLTGAVARGDRDAARVAEDQLTRLSSARSEYAGLTRQFIPMKGRLPR